jgi:hypothetical protein
VKARWAALASLPLVVLVMQPAEAARTARAARPSTASCKPNLARLGWWKGVWGSEGLDGDIAGAVRQAPKFGGGDAPWNAEGWHRMRQLAALNRTHPLRIAAAWGFPTMMNSFSEVKFVIAPDETVMTSQYRDIRYIYTDGRKHPSEDELWVNNWGDSIGCWQGDTLVIDTIGAKFDPEFNYMAPPLSDQAHFTERLRAVAKDRIEGEITITDPVTLSAPWTVKFAFVPAGIDRLVHEGDTLLDREQATATAAVITPPKEDPFDGITVPPELVLPPAQLDRIAGRYRFEGQPGELVVERRGDRLFYRAAGPGPGGGGARPLFADTPLSFSGINGESFKFTANGAGQVVAVERSGFGAQGLKGSRVAS